MSQQAEMKVITEVIRARGYQPIGAMAVTSDEIVHVFKTQLSGYQVYGALRTRKVDSREKYHFSIKFSMCKSGCVNEQGRSLAIGRIMQCNQVQASIGGDLHLEFAVNNFLNVKVNALHSALKDHENTIESLQQIEKENIKHFEEIIQEFI